MDNYIDLKPFRFWCQKALPLVYDDSLSYYELLCKVVDYLNKTVENVETLHTAYEKLQSYVNNYFSSLDVQEEINNKLDEMSKSGELYEIIRRYTDPIVNEQNDKINLLNARMDTFPSTPEMFGAVGDGVTDDTEALRNCLNSGKTIVSSKNKVYLVSESIAITNPTYVDFGGAVIKASTSDKVLVVCTGDATGETSNYSTFKSITIDCNAVSEYGLYVEHGKRNLYENIIIKNCIGTAATFKKSNGSGVRNMYIRNTDASVYLNSIALDIQSTDMSVDGLDYGWCMTGVILNCYGCILNNVHGFIYGKNFINNFDKSIFMQFNSSGKFIVTNSYSDTQKYHFYINHSGVNLAVSSTQCYLATSEDSPDVINKETIDNFGAAYVCFVHNVFESKNISFTNCQFVATQIASLDNIKFVGYLSNLDNNNIYLDDSTHTYHNGGSTGFFINRNNYFGYPNKNILVASFKNHTLSSGISFEWLTNGSLKISGTYTGNSTSYTTVATFDAVANVIYIGNGIPECKKTGDTLFKAFVGSEAFPAGKRLEIKTQNDVEVEAQATATTNFQIAVPVGWSGEAIIYPMIRIRGKGNNTFQSPTLV